MVVAGVGVGVEVVEEACVLLTVVLWLVLDGWVVSDVLRADSELDEADCRLEGLLAPKRLLRLGIPLIPPTPPLKISKDIQNEAALLK